MKPLWSFPTNAWLSTGFAQRRFTFRGHPRTLAHASREPGLAEQEQFRAYACRLADADPALAVGDEIRTLVEGLLPANDD
jgi:hypothetical protein